MSHPLPNMLDATFQKVKEMIQVDSVMGTPITTPEGVTIIPVCKVSYGVGGGGSDFATKSTARPEYPFGGGTAVGAKITPIAFLVINGQNVRMLPVATPANTTTDRVIEMIPDTLDRIVNYIDSHKEKKEAKETQQQEG